MSSPRISKIFIGLTESLRKLGPYANAFKTGLVWSGIDLNGGNACVIDLTSATWATAHLRAVLVSIPAHDSQNLAALKTQSHAAGMFIDGSVSFQLIMEDAASNMSAHAKFQREIMHVLRGQLGAPVELLLTANTVEPKVNGVNGATSTADTTSAGTYQPYFFAVSGGI